MTIEQISVFVENKIGCLVEVTDVLAQHNVDMRALSIAETPDFGILRAIVNDPKKTAKLLSDAGYICKETPVLAVSIEDRPGGLNKVLHVLRDNSINLEYTYAFAGRRTEIAYMVLRVNDSDRAAKVLEENGVKLLSADEIFAH